MQLVADTNAIVAAFLRQGDTRKLLFSKKFEVFSPERIRFEMLANKEEFKEKASMTGEEFHEALELEMEHITIIPVEEYKPFRKSALEICPEGHKDDWPFIALALHLNCSLWSNDKALKKQNKVKVYSTEELIKL